MTKISNLPPATTITGAELIPGVQNGSTVKIQLKTIAFSILSPAAIAALPTTLPTSSGILWNNGGVLSIS